MDVAVLLTSPFHRQLRHHKGLLEVLWVVAIHTQVPEDDTTLLTEKRDVKFVDRQCLALFQ